MAGNRAIYDRAMEQNRESSRQGRWDDALKSAIRALQEFPSDTDGRTATAVALFHTGKLDKALQLLQELHNADVNNPFYLEYIARTQEGQGSIEAAVKTYGSLADLHQKRRAASRTIAALREVLRLRPDLDDQRKRLAALLEETNAFKEAAGEYLALARRYRDRNWLDDAARNTEAALRLDPNIREAKELISELHDAMAKAAGIVSKAETSESTASSHDMQTFRQSAGGLRSQQFALEKMISQAIELQQSGDIDGALKEYERAIEAGMDRADVLYSVGLIYQERGDYQTAIKMLSRATKDTEYAMSSHYALGTCYKALNQLSQAAQEYEHAIRLVDLETIGKSEAEDLIQMYEEVVSIYQHMGDLARSASLYSTLASFLQSKRWGKERAIEFNKRAKELTEQSMLAKLRVFGTGMLTQPSQSPPPPPPESGKMPETWGKIRPITDFLRADGKIDTTGELTIAEEHVEHPDPLQDIEKLLPPEIPTSMPVTPLDMSELDDQAKRWVIASEKYIEQGLLEAALDACHEVVRLNVDYLPIHLRKGEIYERQGRPQVALNKYQLLIDTYMVRNEPERAIDVYYRAIELSPDTLNIRSNFADILYKAGRVEEAAKQLSQVASSYFRMGQTNRALEEYRRVLQWSPKDKDLHTEYGLALFKMERYESALGEFRKALDIDPNDLTTIARINITLAVMGDQPVTVWDSLATLLEQLKTQPQTNNLIQAEYRTTLLIVDVPILHYILGIIQQYSNQHASAIMEFEQAQTLIETEPCPMLPKILIHQALADSYIALGQAEQALHQLRQAQMVAEKAPVAPLVKHAFAMPLSQGDMVRRMAEAFAASEDLEGAEKALLEARRLLPYDRTVYTKLADVYFRQGKLNEAIAQLDQLADHYESHQHLDHAIETLQDTLKLAPSNIAIGGKLARLYIRRGYPDKGVEGLIRVAELQRKAGQHKDAVASLQQVAEILWMQGKHEEVRTVYDKIVQIAPNDIEARQWLSIMHTLAFRTNEAIAEKKAIVRIFAEQRDYDNAIAELHQIIGLNQKDLDAYYMLGDMLMRRGEFGQTVQLYKRMLKMEGIETERVEALLAAANRMYEQQQQAHTS